MTIAACYLSPEGVVLGSDSTSTYENFGQRRHYNHGQKLFEVGEKSTIGIVTWGVGGLRFGSYRTLIARLSDQMPPKSAVSVLNIANRWIDLFWDEYTACFAAEISTLKQLNKKPPLLIVQGQHDPNTRNPIEEMEFRKLSNNLVVGFCLGGYVPVNRTPFAYEIVFDPLSGKPAATELPPAQSFWGVPSLIGRLINGCADELRSSIFNSGKWTGTEADLDRLIAQHKLSHPATVPIRDAIDFTHACLLTTVKAMKFSSLPQICGGPLELAVITTDRSFRWVRHKPWDAAIMEEARDDHVT